MSAINAIGLLRAIDEMGQNQEISEDALLAVRDTETGKVYSISNIVAEYHEDADGSHTVWLEVEAQ
jgi:hypothetical protein